MSIENNGEMVSKYLKNHLINCYGNRIHIQKFIDYIKINHCFISLDLEKDLANFKSETHTLPDGTQFQIGAEAFLCAEKLFERSNIDSLQQAIFDSLSHFSHYGKFCF